MEAAALPEGLASAEAQRRLDRLGPLESTTSRSVASIVAANVFTLFNAIIAVFFGRSSLATYRRCSMFLPRRKRPR